MFILMVLDEFSKVLKLVALAAMTGVSKKVCLQSFLERLDWYVFFDCQRQKLPYSHVLEALMMYPVCF